MKGIGVLSSRDLRVKYCSFENMEVGIKQESISQKIQKIELVHNCFQDNRTAISLNRTANTSGTAIYDFTLKCNQFKLTCAETNAPPCNTEPLRKGLVIGEGVRVKAPNNGGDIDNAIGGTNSFNTSGDAYPNANEWPVAFGTDRAVFPTSSANLQALWNSPINWKSLENDLSNPTLTYNRYRNEFVHSNVMESLAFETFPVSGLNVKTAGTPGNPSGYDNTCQGLIDDPDPIFPARIAVVTDSQSVTSIGFMELQSGPWLGEAIPNPAQSKTKVLAYIPTQEEMAILQFIEFGTGKVISAKAISERGKLEIEIDLSHFAAGVYGCQVILKDKKLGAKRFLVVK